MSQIKDQNIQDHCTRTYLHYLTFQQGDSLIDNMETVIKEIYHHQYHASKIDLSFSFILQHQTLEYRYFYASNNVQLLKSRRLILNKQDSQNLSII